MERFPENWKELATRYADRDYPVGMYVIGPFGHLRNLFGDENLMYMMFDDPSIIHEIMENWCRFYEGFLPMVCKDVVPDMIMVWEDMCYRNGPLISPELYRQFMLPYLKRVINRANDLGIVGIIIDNDGNCTSMLPLYLEAGGNVFYPFECQAGMDIVKVREQYGSRFTIIGGIDKYLLSDEYGTSDIVAEIDRKMRPMMVPGGYIPMLDHSTPPNIPLANFETFLDYCRRLPEIMKSENSMEKRNH
jgi:uroporphyrinogen decarboxylase